MVPNGPPKSGACVLNTNSLRALLDSTVASCNNWKDPEGIGIDSYTFYYPHSTTEITLASSGFNTVNLIFPVGIFDVWCRIADKFGSFTNVYVGKVNASMITKEEFQSYNPSSVLRNLAAIGDQTTMAMVLISLASIKDHADWLSLSDSSFSNMSASEINDRLTQVSNMNKESLDFAADTMDFASLSQLSVGAGVLKSSACGVLTQEKAAFTVDMDFREKSLNFMNKMMGKLNVTPIYSPYDIQPFASSFLDAAVCILKSMNEVIENPTLSPPGDLAKASSLDYETGIDQTKIGFVIPLDPVTQMKQNVLEITRQRAKGMVQKMFQLVDSLGSVILGKCVVGENIIEQGDSGTGMLVTKISEDTLADGVEIRPQNSLNASVAFPGSFCPSRYSQNYSDCTNVVGFTAVVWPCLTHVYPESMTYLSKETTVITLSVFVEDENVTVDNETQPITLVIPRRPESLPDPVSVVGNTDINDLVPFVYHSFNVSSADSAFTVEIHPDGNTPPKLVILIDYKRLPTPSQYDTISYVKNFTLNENGTYSWFVNNIDNKNRTGNFYVAVAILKDNVTLPDPRSNATLQKENFSVDFNFNYTFRVITSGCYFYNSTIDVWSGIGMTVVDANSTHTSCHTLHLTSFGSGYSPSPNAIDFDYIFAAAGFVNNLIIYLVIIITLVCYVIMMIWARFMDKRDVQYRGVTALEDNKVEDKYLYEVTFTTGPDKEAGTDSNIQFIVSGEYDETGVRALPPSDNRRYHRYSVDVFVMSTHGPLGNIDTLRIWHDNTGRSPFDSWQLQTVVIRDLQTRDKFIFHANTWLALDHDDKKIDVLLEPSDGETNEEFITGFYNKGNRGANEDHMWISIFLRPTGSRYSRKERVSVATLYLYLSMLINAACYHILSDTPRTGVFEYSSFTLSIQQVIIGLASGIMAYPVIFLLVFIFKRSRPRKLKKCRSLEAAAKQRRNQHIESGTDTEKDDLLTDYDLTTHQTRSNRSKDSSPVRCIPWWTRWLAWLLILAGIGVCAFFVWSYGIMWGEIKSVKWFSSFIISFFISVLVTQWLKVLLTTTIGVVCCKAQNTMTEDIDCDEELPELRYDEEWKNVQPMDPSVKRKVHVMGGVDSSEAEVAAIATRLTEKREMNVVLRDVGSYCIFLLVLFVLVNGQTNYNAFLLQAQMTNTFIKIGNPQFDFSSKVTTTDQFWYWMQNVILQELRAQRWYNGDPPYGLRGFLDDRANRILGYGIIRQIRSDPRRCKVPISMRNVIHNCSGSRLDEIEDTRNFCDSWSAEEVVHGSCVYDEFRYKTAAELQTYSTQGILGTYSGGGYVISLNSLEADDIQKLQTMPAMGWIDKYTRAVLVEFSIYNANVNLFSTCSIVAEFIEGGGVTPSWRFEPVQLIQNPGSFGYIETLCQLIFVIVTVIFTLWELWKIKKLKWEYLSSYWNMAEICIILTSYATIYVFVERYFLTQAAMEIFNNTYGDGYVRLDSAVYKDKLYLYLIALIVFFSTMKLIKLLQFNKRIDVLALTVRRCWDELIVSFIAFCIVFIAFNSVFYFIFMTELLDFTSFLTSAATSFEILLGVFDFDSMYHASALSPVFFFAFCIINTVILINIMLTTIMVAFRDVKLELRHRKNKYDVIDFVWTQIRQTLRLEAEPDNSVAPNVEDVSLARGGPDDASTDQLPDKVNQLMQYINDVYFDGHLNLSDPASMKQITQGQLPSASFQPYTTKSLSGGRNPVVSSD
nr:polycystic kidney disease protein 1-like 2 [Procambarus clarkii]